MLYYEPEDGLYTAGPYFVAKVTGQGRQGVTAPGWGRGRDSRTTLYRGYREAFC